MEYLKSPVILRILGTALSGTLAALAMHYIAPGPMRDAALAQVPLVLGWLHLPRPGDAKVAP